MFYWQRKKYPSGTTYNLNYRLPDRIIMALGVVWKDRVLGAFWRYEISVGSVKHAGRAPTLQEAKRKLRAFWTRSRLAKTKKEVVALRKHYE